MRQTRIFSGSSHPQLVEQICDRLGMKPAKAELGKFSNGETRIQIGTSVRDQDVFIIQSGSSTVNDSIMELLIMISACKSGSARSITAVLPYFPYSRQSKKKSHRGAITARMLANLLDVAGVNHVITIDLHASQMQGFFRCPVDNLVAEPLIAKYVKKNIPRYEWESAVVVSKNPGGTKRVTSLADALKLKFGIIMTDRYRPGSGRASMRSSAIFDPGKANGGSRPVMNWTRRDTSGTVKAFEPLEEKEEGEDVPPPADEANGLPLHGRSESRISRYPADRDRGTMISGAVRVGGSSSDPSEKRENDEEVENDEDDDDDDDDDAFHQDVHTGRLVQGHVVDEPEGSLTNSFSGRPFHALRRQHSMDNESIPETMTNSVLSSALSSVNVGADSGLGGSGDATHSSDEEEANLTNPAYESTVTLVGNVKDKVVFIVDDMIDKPASWIAAAETVVKVGGATKVYCLATHGLFGGSCLTEMEECSCIHRIVVTDSLPITEAMHAAAGGKLDVLNVASMLAESIRRNHHGESMSHLFSHGD